MPKTRQDGDFRNSTPHKGEKDFLKSPPLNPTYVKIPQCKGNQPGKIKNDIGIQKINMSEHCRIKN